MLFSKSNQKAKSIIQLLFSIFWILLLAYFVITIFILSIGQNVYQENYSSFSQKTINSILPQGWGFFTRNPIETKYRIYSIKDSKLELVNRKNSSPQNLFGLSRKSRRFGYEFSKIYTSIKPRNWNISTNASIEHYKISYLDTLTLNSNYFLIKEGKYLITKYENVPWAWSKQIKKDKIIEYANVIIKK